MNPLDYRPPLAWADLLEFLGARAIPGVEHVTRDGQNPGGAYIRTVRVGDYRGDVRVSHDPVTQTLRVGISQSLAMAGEPLIARLRHLFDLDADPRVIAAHLQGDRLLEQSVSATPGLRLPGAFDGFEMAVRAILGQQVSVRGATTLAGRLAEVFGEPIVTSHEGLARLTPTADTLAAASPEMISRLGILPSRAATIVTLSQAIANGLIDLSPGAPPQQVLPKLKALKGIGEWTAQYIAMRALHWPDAFLAGDLGIHRALGGMNPKDAAARAEAWRPWRAYAAMHLWKQIK